MRYLIPLLLFTSCTQHNPINVTCFKDNRVVYEETKTVLKLQSYKVCGFSCQVNRLFGNTSSVPADKCLVEVQQ